ncbi:unnamed protein product [Periconia digitata]|uniref:RBR-type E3 ubiquitin transferase n=1 Tax=Periconia digitata TaxID=1303443 RepID=A0A9W4UE66_9PLEO|nr:unnamed protein product [Periconia digitata]
MSELYAVQPHHATSFEDELAAIALQLEEIGIHADVGKGKYAVDHPPDSEIAYASFQAELRDYHTFLLDQRVAHSIGTAVHCDGAVVADLTLEEIRCHEDRLFAIQTSNHDSEFQRAPESALGEPEDNIRNWMNAATESQYSGSILEFSDDEDYEDNVAGPSVSYAERQAGMLEKLSRQVRCAVCLEYFHSGATIPLSCQDRYCVDCLKGLFVRATKDETLFPVRCHKKPIPLQLIAKHMSTVELAAYERASIEFSTADRVYCSNRDCGEFIPPRQIELGTHKSECELCNTSTCGLCKNEYHDDMDCPNDPELQVTRDLAGEMGWKTCYRCGYIVGLRSGCNHMTCRCKAEFCYECGTEWKHCECDHANADRIMERAEEIVDRDAVADLAPIERQRRVRQVRARLEENHECEHPGKFQRIYHGGRRGFRCEMCDERHWKYILQCRRCQINLCEDCRRNRI